LGAALVLRDRRHIRVEFFIEHLPHGVRQVVECAGLIVVLGFNAFLVVAGVVWVWQTSGTYTPALGLPLNWIFYAALPLTAILCCYFAARRLATGQYAELDVGEDEELPD
jgi:TRAP-type C4-dicarboxylate transport system permease small subunit